MNCITMTTLNVNGRDHTAHIDPGTPILQPTESHS